MRLKSIKTCHVVSGYDGFCISIVDAGNGDNRRFLVDPTDKIVRRETQMPVVIASSHDPPIGHIATTSTKNGCIHQTWKFANDDT